MKFRIKSKKIFIIGDNLGGGGALLASTIIDELCIDPNVSEFRGWVSKNVKFKLGGKFKNFSLTAMERFVPKWIMRSVITKSLGNGWIILNLTNFPISKLGINENSIEIALFHNAYFMASPKGAHNPLPFYFKFRQIFLRRTLLKFLMFFYDPQLTKLVVQTNFMAKLSKPLFGDLKVNVALLHRPPMMHLKEAIPKLKINKREISEFWFYPASAEPHKNHLLLIDICERSVNEGKSPRILITITPKTSQEKAILKEIRCRGLTENIINIGWLKESERQWIYNKCKGILFLSTFESLGISLLEARFFGLPLLCADSSLAREMLGDNFGFYNIENIDDRNLLADALTTNIANIPKAPFLKKPKRIVDAYCLDHLTFEI